MARWLLTVEAQDRPGIVASVTDALARAGCNLADVSMTRLSGVFVMLAVVSTPNNVDPQELWSATEFEGTSNWREISDAHATPRSVAGERWNITVYGSDKPGIVSTVTSELSKRGVNIDDLSTRLVEQTGTYTMLIDVTIPISVDIDELQADLTQISERLGVTCHARSVDADTL